MRSKTTHQLVASILAVGVYAGAAQGQSSDALLNKLVSKGILTQQEADELKKDDKNVAAATVTHGLGLPDWVTSLKLYGDFRGRYEEHLAESDDFHARPRYRYRVRMGLNVNMLENFDVGFRVASGNPQTNPGGTLVGGQSITANQDLNSLESRKFLWIDAAYAKWSPIKNDDWTVTGMIGKFDNPFQLSNMIWDYDIVPEGAGLTVAYNVNKEHTLKGVGAYIVLDELNQGLPSGSKVPASAGSNPAHDPNVAGGQLIWEAKWTPKFDTLVSGAFFVINSKDSLSAMAQPFYNSGNTRDTNGFLANSFNPIIGTAAATYRFPAIPIYNGKEFPVKIAGEYIDNLAVDSKGIGWRAGVTIGKAGRKNTWEIMYRYQRLEADAWFDALTDDDNTAFFATGNPQMVGTGKANGMFGGTNIKGHQVVATYSFTDFMNFTFIYYNNQTIVSVPHKDSGAQHFMAELNWKF